MLSVGSLDRTGPIQKALAGLATCFQTIVAKAVISCQLENIRRNAPQKRPIIKSHQQSAESYKKNTH